MIPRGVRHVIQNPLVLLLVSGAIFCGFPLCAEEPPVRVSVLTYNIHHGEGTDQRFDLERLAAVIKSAEPDLVALQEVDRSTDRSSGVDQIAKLSELTGLKGAFGEALELGGGGYGLAILSRWPLLETKVHRLPADGGIEQRIAFVARVRAGGEAGPDLDFIVTHLDHQSDATHRMRQVEKIRELFPTGAAARPMLLAGDMNATPNSAVMKTLLTDWTDTAAGTEFFTIPAAKPRRRIDYIMVRPADRWRTIETRAIEEPVASDHRPVLSVLELKR